MFYWYSRTRTIHRTCVKISYSNNWLRFLLKIFLAPDCFAKWVQNVFVIIVVNSLFVYLLQLFLPIKICFLKASLSRCYCFQQFLFPIILLSANCIVVRFVTPNVRSRSIERILCPVSVPQRLVNKRRYDIQNIYIHYLLAAKCVSYFLAIQCKFKK